MFSQWVGCISSCSKKGMLAFILHMQQDEVGQSVTLGVLNWIYMHSVAVLALLPFSKTLPCLNPRPGWRPYCVESACSLVKKHARQVDWSLEIARVCVCEWENGRSPRHVSPVIIWWAVQGWDRLKPSTNQKHSVSGKLTCHLWRVEERDRSWWHDWYFSKHISCLCLHTFTWYLNIEVLTSGEGRPALM